MKLYRKMIESKTKKQQFKHFNSFYYKMSTYKKDNVQALKLNKNENKTKQNQKHFSNATFKFIISSSNK